MIDSKAMEQIYMIGLSSQKESFIEKSAKSQYHTFYRSYCNNFLEQLSKERQQANKSSIFSSNITHILPKDQHNRSIISTSSQMFQFPSKQSHHSKNTKPSDDREIDRLSTMHKQIDRNVLVIEAKSEIRQNLVQLSPKTTQSSIFEKKQSISPKSIKSQLKQPKKQEKKQTASQFAEEVNKLQNSFLKKQKPSQNIIYHEKSILNEIVEPVEQPKSIVLISNNPDIQNQRIVQEKIQEHQPTLIQTQQIKSEKIQQKNNSSQEEQDFGPSIYDLNRQSKSQIKHPESIEISSNNWKSQVKQINSLLKRPSQNNPTIVEELLKEKKISNNTQTQIQSFTIHKQLIEEQVQAIDIEQQELQPAQEAKEQTVEKKIEKNQNEEEQSEMIDCAKETNAISQEVVNQQIQNIENPISIANEEQNVQHISNIQKTIYQYQTIKQQEIVEEQIDYEIEIKTNSIQNNFYQSLRNIQKKLIEKDEQNKQLVQKINELETQLKEARVQNESTFNKYNQLSLLYKKYQLKQKQQKFYEERTQQLQKKFLSSSITKDLDSFSQKHMNYTKLLKKSSQKLRNHYKQDDFDDERPIGISKVYQNLDESYESAKNSSDEERDEKKSKKSGQS